MANRQNWNGQIDEFALIIDAYCMRKYHFHFITSEINTNKRSKIIYLSSLNTISVSVCYYIVYPVANRIERIKMIAHLMHIKWFHLVHVIFFCMDAFHKLHCSLQQKSNKLIVNIWDEKRKREQKKLTWNLFVCFYSYKLTVLFGKYWMNASRQRWHFYLIGSIAVYWYGNMEIIHFHSDFDSSEHFGYLKCTACIANCSYLAHILLILFPFYFLYFSFPLLNFLLMLNW